MRVAPPGVVTMAARELSLAKINFAMTSRFSTCLKQSEPSAPTACSKERSVPPATSSVTNGSMPPSLATVALFALFSCVTAHRAAADCSFTSAVPSRTRVHRGAIAPVRATAAWMS